jgi:transposase
MLSIQNASIWLYCEPIDFRKQLDGLIVEIAHTLEKDPASGQWFVFRNKQANKIKIIVWENNGFWMLYKRVEKGRFQFPEKSTSDIQLTPHQLTWLLSGISMHQRPSITPLNPTSFY